MMEQRIVGQLRMINPKTTNADIREFFKQNDTHAKQEEAMSKLNAPVTKGN